MKEENFDLSIEIPLRNPLKQKQKQVLSDSFINEFKKNGISKIDSQQPHYIERRSADLSQSIVFGLQISGPILSMIASVLGIYRLLGKQNTENKVFVRRKDGKYVKITDEMTEEDILKSLQDKNDKTTE